MHIVQVNKVQLLQIIVDGVFIYFVILFSKANINFYFPK